MKKEIVYLVLCFIFLQSAAQSSFIPEPLGLDFSSSKTYAEVSAVFHPNEKEYYFTGFDSKGSPTIMVSYLENNKWSTPSSLIEGDGMIPAITKDGQKLYYSSVKLTNDDDERMEPNIWVMQREDDKWGAPQPLGPEVNTPDLGEWFPSVTDDGTLYFKKSNFMEETERLYYAELKNGQHQEAVLLKAKFNTSINTEDPFVAPDKSYVIFSPGGPELFGPMHITFQNMEGKWSTPKDMGLEGTMPSLSPNGNYLIFIKNEDVYKVDTQIVESLR